MRFPAYSRTKPSGVEWLEDVPEHWEVKRSDAVIESEKRQVPPEKFENEEIFHYSIPSVQQFGTGQIERGETVASAKQAVTEPVVLVSRLNPRKATICRAEPKEQRTLASTEFVALKALKCDLHFLEYLVSTELFRQRLDSWVQSVTRSHQRASPELIYRFWCAWPDSGEQRAIAAFLDQETGRLDQLVAKKRELIERLKEKRTALISRAVTRGLPAKVAGLLNLPETSPRKAPDLPWCDSVPAQWICGNLRRFALMRTGHTPSRNEESYWLDCTIPWFTLADVWQLRDGKQKFLGPTAESISEPGLNNSAAELLPAGTVVLSRTASVGFSGIMPVPMATSQDFWNWICGPKLLPEFLLWLFRAMRQEFERLTSGSTHKTIYQPDAASLRICVPPIPEQQAIIAYLDAETAKLDALAAKVEEAIERLQEYRSALITAAVTGKIDVRGARGSTAGDASPTLPA